MLGYDTQLLRYDTAGRCVNTVGVGVGLVNQFGNALSEPVDGLAYMENLRLNELLGGVLRDLVVNETVAEVSAVSDFQCVAINAVGNEVMVEMIAYLDLLALAEEDALVSRRDRIYLEVQRVELLDEAVLEDGIGVHTRRVVRLAAPHRVRRVKNADGHVLAVLGYDTQLLRYDTAGRCVNTVGVSVGLVNQFGNALSEPVDRFAYVENLRLNEMLGGVLRDLVEDEAVAEVLAVSYFQRVAINAVGNEVMIRLVADLDLVAFAEEYLCVTGRDGVHLERQGMEFLHESVVVEYGVCVVARSAEMMSEPSVISRIVDADSPVLVLLGYYMQLIEISTMRRLVVFPSLVRLRRMLNNQRIVPCFPRDRLVNVLDDTLLNNSRSRYGHMYINNTVADAVLRLNRNSVVINSVRLTCDIAVNLTANRLRGSCTYLIILMCFRLGVNGQVQAVDTVGFVYSFEAVFVLFGLSDLVLDGFLLLVARRAVNPKERKVGLTDGRVLLEQVSRINDQVQVLFVNTTAGGYYRVVVRAGAGQLDRLAGQLVLPDVRQLFVSNDHGVRIVCQYFVEVEISLDDTVATVDRMELGDNGVRFDVIFAVVVDRIALTRI